MDNREAVSILRMFLNDNATCDDKVSKDALLLAIQALLEREQNARSTKAD